MGLRVLVCALRFVYAEGHRVDGSVRVLRPAGSPFTSLHHPPHGPRQPAPPEL